MKTVVLLALCFYMSDSFAQSDTARKILADTIGKITVIRDNRLDLLGKKQAAINEAIANGPRSAKGFRLMLLSTNDRALAMNLRAQLLQKYPDQKVYMSFHPPYIKLKFGNFLERTDAEKMRDEITKAKLVSNNIYVIPEIIEVKGDKLKDKEKDKDN